MAIWLATEALAPAPTAALLLLLIAWHSAATRADAAVWGVVATLFAAVLPFAYVIHRVHRRELTDRHVRVREQRLVPLLVAGLSVATGLTLLAVWGAPRDVLALLGAMLAGLVVGTAVTAFWKVSFHTAVISGAVVVLWLVFGPVLLLLTPLVGLVGWARVISGDHSPAQATIGATIGALTAAGVFSLLR